MYASDHVPFSFPDDISKLGSENSQFLPTARLLRTGKISMIKWLPRYKMKKIRLAVHPYQSLIFAQSKCMIVKKLGKVRFSQGCFSTCT